MSSTRNIRFIHCADLHIDSPFKGISEVHPELRELLYQSTYQSFNNIVELAIKEEVDCVLIAGDIYDSADKSLQAQIKFRNGLQRLAGIGIQSFIIYGNHDSLDSWSATLEWPENVIRFGGDDVECYPLMRNGEEIAQIYGISFPTRDVTDNLSLLFEREEHSIPAIGLLHTNLGENTGHKPYAPASREDLISRRMDYWALGHVHDHRILNDGNPAIVYPGNSQARNPKETGVKGCCLVTLDQSGDCDIEFIATDVIRYKSDYLDISTFTSIDEIMNTVRGKCEDIAGEMDGRHAIIRLSLTGRTDFHWELQRGDYLQELQAQIRESFEGRNPWIWLEKLTLGIAGTYDIDDIRHGSDLIADIISLYDELEDDDCEQWEGIHEILKPLFTTWQGQKYLEELTQEELLALAKEARNWTLDKMVEVD